MAVSPLEPTDPQRLGDIVLTGRLGAGGMGIVYMGRRTTDDAPVAVKLVRADLAHDPTFRERFRREVEALRRVSGPRVARLVAADTEAPQPYLVTEFVDGPTLADSVAVNGPVAGDRLRALAAALAEAIVMIHEVGVIHRDLKPSNVILAADQPKLVDFGIAAAAGSMPLTMVGTVIGSAGWMAPEQAAGEVSTPAVDVFTWAALVAYAGTGRPPFGVGGPEEVTNRILSGEPDLRGLPQEVRPFVEAAFIKDPRQRPTAKALLSGLVGVTASDVSTDELVEETSSLIAHTWVMPSGGWPVAATPAPSSPPPPPPAAAVAAAPAPPSTPPARRRGLVPVLVVLAVVALTVGIAAALLNRGGNDEPNAASGTPAPTTGGQAPPATLPAATTTAAPPTTTTTAIPLVDMTIQMTISRNVLDDFLDEVLGQDRPGGVTNDCEAPETQIRIENPQGDILVPNTPLPAGALVTGGLADDCRYELPLGGVEQSSSYVVQVHDVDDGDLNSATVTETQLVAAGGVVDLNSLIDVQEIFTLTN